MWSCICQVCLGYCHPDRNATCEQFQFTGVGWRMSVHSASPFPSIRLWQVYGFLEKCNFDFVWFFFLSWWGLLISTFFAVQPDFHCTQHQLLQLWPPYACILPRPAVQAVYVSLIATSSAYSLISDPVSSGGITQDISVKFSIASCEKKNVYYGRFVLNVQSVWNCVSS